MSREYVVIRASIKSIAGMTVARLGVDREKKRVASFRILDGAVSMFVFA